MKKQFILVLSFLLFLFISISGLNGCRQKKSEDDESGRSTAKALVAVKVGILTEKEASVFVEALGKTDALRKEKSYAPIAGRVITLNVYEGSDVKKGDVLVTLQTKESDATILGAETRLRSAVSPEQKSEAERILQLARSTQNSVSVVAKFDGIVSTRSVSEGELVAENAELLTIVDLSTIDFLADVPLREVSSIHTGDHATVQFQSVPLKKFSASVEAVNPQADMQSQTVKVRLQFLAPNGSLRSMLRTEMVGTARILIGIRPHAFFVPKTALLRNDENNSFWIEEMTRDSLSKSIPVSVGTSTDSLVEVRGENLRPGMTVVIEGNYALADSTRLMIAE